LLGRQISKVFADEWMHGQMELERSSSTSE